MIILYFLQEWKQKRGGVAMPPVIDKEKCVNCGLCAQICCMDVIKKSEDTTGEVYVRYPNECWHCRACAIDCPKGAITMRYPLSHMMFYIDVPNSQGGTESWK